MSEDLNRVIGRLEAKVDLILERQSETQSRLTKVESDVTKTMTVGGLAALAVTALSTIIPTFWSK